MPAPELTVQTPGDQLANAISTATASTGTPDANEQNTADTQAPAPAAALYVIKHNGGPRWIVIDSNAPQVDGKDVKVGDFTGTKDEALAEAERLNAGGEPLVLDPRRENEPKPATTTASTDTIDASKLTQAVMTPDGWLCPEPKAKD